MSLRMTRGQIERQQRRDVPAKFSPWRSEAVKDLALRHGITNSLMTTKAWRDLFIAGKSPAEASDVARRQHWNSRPAEKRLKPR